MNSAADFRTCALASGLVTAQQLEAADASLRAGDTKTRRRHGEGFDRRLADQLVAMGTLTRYQAEQLLAGRSTFRLGPYLILGSLGQGGMGQVFKAEHTLMGRTVALKVLPRHKHTADAEARFLREIRAQAQLDHENLVRALDAGHHGNVYYLVTEYVEGQNLRRLVRRLGWMSIRGAVAVATQVARALDHAHRRGLIHRDVKPGNVLVTPEGRAKLSDLGLVGSLSDAEDELSVGKIVGTADYVAPEQIRQPHKPEPCSDIYSLGCTLYYMVTGKVPFPGGTTRDKCYHHLHTSPFDPRRLNPRLPDAFVDVLGDMMEKDPKRRLRTAGEVIDRFSRWYDPTWQLDEEEEQAVCVPPVRAPGAPRSGSSGEALSDTTPSLLPAESPGRANRHGRSEASQRTAPIAGASEETVPGDHLPPVGRGRWRRYTLGEVLLGGLMLIGSGVALWVLLQVFLGLR